jgi:GrpB protein
VSVPSGFSRTRLSACTSATSLGSPLAAGADDTTTPPNTKTDAPSTSVSMRLAHIGSTPPTRVPPGGGRNKPPTGSNGCLRQDQSGRIAADPRLLGFRRATVLRGAGRRRRDLGAGRGLPKLTESIALVDYDHEWPGLVRREAARFAGLLGDRALRIEHVGSTAAPGLPAKPIIDIDLVVADSTDEVAYLPALQSAGTG